MIVMTGFNKSRVFVRAARLVKSGISRSFAMKTAWAEERVKLLRRHNVQWTKFYNEELERANIVLNITGKEQVS